MSIMVTATRIITNSMAAMGINMAVGIWVLGTSMRSPTMIIPPSLPLTPTPTTLGIQGPRNSPSSPTIIKTPTVTPSLLAPISLGLLVSSQAKSGSLLVNSLDNPLASSLDNPLVSSLDNPPGSKTKNTTTPSNNGASRR